MDLEIDSIPVVKSKTYFSPLRYPGGKASLSSFLSNLIDENDLNECTYLEPFAGGAGAALTLLMSEKVERIIINDYDRAIYALWLSIKQNTTAFIDMLERAEISIDEWYRQREVYKNPKSNDLELGFATFYLNRTNRSGILEGGPIGGKNQAGKWDIGARFNKENLVKRIKKISLYSDRIQVRNEDGIELMNGLSEVDNLLVYLDPPYYVKGSQLYLNHYQHHNHEELAKCLNGSKHLKWLLTYDNTPEILALYPDRKKVAFSLNYHASAAKVGKEVLVLSDSLRFPQT